MATIGPTLSPAAASVPGEAHDSGVCPGEAYESAMADMGDQQDWLGDYRKPLNMFICVTFQEICKQIVRSLPAPFAACLDNSSA